MRLLDLGYVYNPNKFRFERSDGDTVVAWIAEELVLDAGEDVVARETYRMLASRAGLDDE